jgi:hypothetical protein
MWTGVSLNYIEISSSFLTENIILFYVIENQLILFGENRSVLLLQQYKYKYEIQSPSMLHHEVVNMYFKKGSKPLRVINYFLPCRKQNPCPL